MLSCLIVGTAVAQTGTLVEEFELGDSVEPALAGTGDILSLGGVTGPDWEEFFHADGSLKDEVDETGNPPGNGIPDFKDLYEGLEALFIGDDVSAGTSTDLTVAFGSDRLNTGPVAAVDDLANAYVYLTRGAADNLLLFAGFERIQTGEAEVEFEFNQGLFRLGHGWPLVNGWEIVGERSPKDLRIRIAYAADGLMSSVTVESWEDPEADGTFSWVLKEQRTTEGCSPGDPEAVPPVAADTVCAFGNATSVPGGDWPSFDASGSTVTDVDANCFFEVGVNVGELLGISDPTYAYETVRLKTASDLAFGYIGEGN